ncbi:hypothetical protein [Filifactor villosus]|uniref:Uncharacterized protein n=1 Tax=Filifactor villosus TaxID=29374 RepID=A0ABV9QIZ8_9FIRM
MNQETYERIQNEIRGLLDQLIQEKKEIKKFFGGRRTYREKMEFFKNHCPSMFETETLFLEKQARFLIKEIEDEMNSYYDYNYNFSVVNVILPFLFLVLNALFLDSKSGEMLVALSSFVFFIGVASFTQRRNDMKNLLLTLITLIQRNTQA